MVIILPPTTVIPTVSPSCVPFGTLGRKRKARFLLAVWFHRSCIVLSFQVIAPYGPRLAAYRCVDHFRLCRLYKRKCHHSQLSVRLNWRGIRNTQVS